MTITGNPLHMEKAFKKMKYFCTCSFLILSTQQLVLFLKLKLTSFFPCSEVLMAPIVLILAYYPHKIWLLPVSLALFCSLFPFALYTKNPFLI